MKLFKIIKWVPDTKVKKEGSHIELIEFVAAERIETIIESLKLDFADERIEVVSIGLAAENVIMLSEKEKL